MVDDKLIEEARSRARLLSETSGLPYHTMLEEIARSAGRKGWAEYVRSPVPLPTSVMGGVETEDRAGIVQDDGRGVDHRPSRWKRIASRRGAVAILAVLVLAVAITGYFRQQSAIARSIAILEWERGNSASVDMPFWRNLPVGRIHGPRTARFADVVIVDARPWRATWRYRWARTFESGEFHYYGPGGQRMQQAMLDHPIVAMSMQIDCGRGRWRTAGSVITDSYLSEPVASAGYPFKPGRGWMEMGARNRSAVCERSGTTA